MITAIAIYVGLCAVAVWAVSQAHRSTLSIEALLDWITEAHKTLPLAQMAADRAHQEAEEYTRQIQRELESP